MQSPTSCSSARSCKSVAAGHYYPTVRVAQTYAGSILPEKGASPPALPWTALERTEGGDGCSYNNHMQTCACMCRHDACAGAGGRQGAAGGRGRCLQLPQPPLIASPECSHPLLGGMTFCSAQPMFLRTIMLLCEQLVHSLAYSGQSQQSRLSQLRSNRMNLCRPAFLGCHSLGNLS